MVLVRLRQKRSEGAGDAYNAFTVTVSRATLLLALVACGCSKGGFSKRGGSEQFRYPISNFTTLDPAKVQDVDSIDLLDHVYEGLVSYDESNKVVPQLAESWKVSSDRKTYTFSLRQNAKFHNGRLVTAEDVKWSLERSLSPKANSSTASNYLGDIVGVKEFVAGKAASVSGIRVLNPHSLSLTIDRPRAFFLGKLTYPCAFVFAKEAIPEGEIAKPGEAVGTGPFRIGRYLPDQSIQLLANKEYYLGAPSVDAIERPIVKDASTRLNLYRSGQLDMVSVERQDLPAVQSDPKLKDQLEFRPRPAINYLMMNPAAYAPFGDVHVRRAFTLAIDRERICSEVMGGVPVAKGLLPPGVLGYRENPPTALGFSPAKARAELALAGYGSRPLPPLSLALRASMPAARLMAEAVINDLQKNLGVKVSLREMEWRTLLETRNQHKLAFVVSSWYADYVDPENFLSFLLKTGSSQNYEQYSNAEFDTLCGEADVSTDSAKRADLYDKAEDILLRDAVRIPIYVSVDATLVSPRVKGLRHNLMGDLPHRMVSLKP